ncbi:MAG TPA: selenocysteine-specific translation elongation factor, partial [Nitrolancea sp.]
TAGHVDHGKSTLVKALTGIDPDRLREEKEREMTIDLGFAWLALPSGRQVSIVDVPGHERFIKNMLAGVGGIDAAVLVIAADEGPMPQTDEHLAILDLLQIERGIVALTKIDTVDDDWRELVTEEIREKLIGSTLAGAPIVPVSALSGAGLDDLRAAIDEMLEQVSTHNESGRPRLPIDRVFTISGFGTVVTGTLLDGPLDIGQEIEIQPSGRRGRVRGLQSHRAKVERALPGTRTAVNLSGLAVEDLVRGDVLTTPGWLAPTKLIDAQLRLIADAPLALEQNDEVGFFTGSSETLARVTLLNDQQIEPGEETWVQFRFPEPIAVIKGDRFIIRQPSPSLTIGGGVVIDPHPKRHRRFRSDVIDSLEVLAAGTPSEIVAQAIGGQPVEFRALSREVALPDTELRAAVDELIANGNVVLLRRTSNDGPLVPTNILMVADAFDAFIRQLRQTLATFHERNPLRRGMAKEEVRSRSGIAARMFEEILARASANGDLAVEGDILRLPEHEIRFTSDQRLRIDRYLSALRANPHTPPPPSDFGIEPDLAIALAETGEVVRVDENIVFARETFDEIQRDVLEIIAREQRITLSGFRDHFGSSRKYAQAVLEYLDDRRVTRRVGDERVRYTGG